MRTTFLLLLSFICNAYSFCILDVLPVKKLVLIGMPGTGKSTIGKRYADFYSIPFYDIDRILISKNPDILAARDWKSFRQEEKRLFEYLTYKDIYVISAGGGLIEDQSNRKLLNLLKEDDVLIINVNRYVHDNIKNSRILPDTWENLEKKRENFYKELSNYSYLNNKTPNNFISWLKQLDFKR